MGGHPSRPAVAGRLQRSTRRHRAGSPRTPAQNGGGPPSLLTLLRVGFTEPHRPPGGRWSLTPPFPPYRLRHRSGTADGLFSVALSRGSPRVAVSDHPALWSPDVPRRRVSPPTRPPSRLVRRAGQSTDTAAKVRHPRCSTDELNESRRS